jgi:ABC-type transporter Mla subunit MlaD
MLAGWEWAIMGGMWATIVALVGALWAMLGTRISATETALQKQDQTDRTQGEKIARLDERADALTRALEQHQEQVKDALKSVESKIDQLGTKIDRFFGARTPYPGVPRSGGG